MSTFLEDLRYGMRMLRRNPSFAIVAMLTLGIGIGANSAIFSVVDAVLLRPLPYPQPEKLVMVNEATPKYGTHIGMSYPNFQDWARSSQSFEELAAMRPTQYALSAGGEASNVTGGAVTASYFTAFRAAPLIGRTLNAQDDAAGAAPVVMLSEQLWRGRFGSDASIVGKSIALDQHPFTVIGVMPASFRPLVPTGKAEIWVPLLQDSVASQLHERRGGHYLTAVGRLKGNVTLSQAQSEMDSIQASLAREFPDANKGWGVRIVPLQTEIVGDARLPLLILLGAVGMVLLISCANVASLLLARATVREREVSIRITLGAGRSRLVRQFLTESVMLGVLGGVAGLFLGFIVIQGLESWLPADLPRISEIHLNARVLGFALALSVISGIIFGLVPALQSIDGPLSLSLKGSAGDTRGDNKRKFLRNGLIVAETAIAVVLLIGSGLLIRSFAELRGVDPGFNPSHLLTAGAALPASRYSTSAQKIAFYREMLSRMNALPGTQDSAAAAPLPLVDGYINLAYQVQGRLPAAQSDEPTADFVAISPNYFHVMQIPVLSGRELRESDSETAAGVCVISQSVARRVFEPESAIGKRIEIGYPTAAAREIVGIVGDVKDVSLASEGAGQVYVPFAQNPLAGVSVAVRTRGEPEALVSGVREQFRRVDSELPVEALLMNRAIDDSVTEPRFRTRLLGFFAGIALILAAIGIYGVIAYHTRLRVREIGIRMALGAQRADVLRLIVGQGFILAVAGVALGLAGAYGLTRYLKSLLFHVNAVDAGTFAVVSVSLILVAVCAAYIPARRATQIDPMLALRYE